MKQRVLILGGDGMLGRTMQAELSARAVIFDAPLPSEVDLLDRGALARAIPGHGLVINCAAWTDVDGAETNEEAATAVNGLAVGTVGGLCRESGARLLHFSTDYVFDGTAKTPYRTDAEPRPINAYGRGKAVGEALLERERAAGLEALLIRTSWLYAPWGRNFVRTISRLAHEKPVLRVVDDQRGRPSAAKIVARASLDLVGEGRTGVLHVTDGGACTWFEFARTIAEYANPRCRVEACTSADFPRPARRPAYGVLDLSETEGMIGPMRHWTESLARVLPMLEP
jgi:dTDP-4-dehydrorhamnose reductase